MGTASGPGSMDQLAAILRNAGFDVQVGQYALRIQGIARTFELADLGDPSPETRFMVDGSGYGVPVEQVARGCERLARCLREHNLAHDFLHVSDDDRQEVFGEYLFTPPD